MNIQRDNSIDTLKGVGILLMILGHMPIPDFLRSFIFSFHMPLFFFVSGYLYKEDSVGHIASKNLRKVMLPYIFTCLIIWAAKAFQGNSSWGMSILLANGSFPVWNYNEYYVGPLWFLVCYFVSLIGFTLMLRISFRYRMALWLTLWVIADIYRQRYNLLPCDILNAIPAILCLQCGYSMKSDSAKRTILHPLSLIVGACIWMLCIIKGNVSMASMSYGLWALQVIGAFYGTCLVYCAIKRFSPSGGGKTIRLLAFTGRNSLMLLCAHSTDYMLKITPAISDFLFDDAMLRNGFLFLLKFMFVYIVFHVFKQMKVLRLVYSIK